MWRKIKARLWALAGNSRTLLVMYGIEVAGYLDESKYLDWSAWFGAERAGRIAMIIGGVAIGLRIVSKGAVMWQTLEDDSHAQ